MSTAADGQCHLRAVTLPAKLDKDHDFGLGGMYATAEKGPDHPINTSAQVPDVMEYQNWFLSYPLDSDEHRILYQSNAPKDSSQKDLGFSNDSKNVGTPIKLATASTYLVRSVGTAKGGADVITIRPKDHLIGLDYYVGVSKNNVLEIQGFEIGTKDGLPGWVVY